MKISQFIAHRGANQIAPENTMLAFEKAYEARARWIELDVQLSADGVLFIFHDNNAKKLTGVDEDLSTWDWVDIQKLSVLETSFLGADATIPSMEEYLQWMAEKPDLYTNIEIKVRKHFDAEYESRLLESLLKLLAEYPQLHQRILLSSFSEYVLDQLAKTNIQIAREFLIEIKDWSLEEAEIFGRIKSKFDTWGCIALGVNHAVLNKARINLLKAQFGILLVYANGLLEDQEVHQLLADGVDSVFIDSMSAMVAVRYQSIGFLATGDEITTGDVLNTNTPKMAESLYAQGFKVGMHLACLDDKQKLKTSLKFLLDQHDVVITVGGLGPTEDDKTCEVIAQVFDLPLVFNEASWQRIYARVSRYFSSVPENNKKQAYFPQDAKILVNEHGTADGCYVHVGDKHLFMLPGPPHECLPLFEKEVLPKLGEICANKKPTRYQWQLLGASEAHIAQLLRPLADEYQIELGYRAAYPYLEVKLHLENTQDVVSLADAITEVVAPFLASTTKQHASELLKPYLQLGIVSINMQKDITKGYLYSHLAQMMPSEMYEPKLSLQLQTNGMSQFWQKKDTAVDDLSLLIKGQDHLRNRLFEQELYVRFRNKGKHSFGFIYEWVCAQVLRVIQKEGI